MQSVFVQRLVCVGDRVDGRGVGAHCALDGVSVGSLGGPVSIDRVLAGLSSCWRPTNPSADRAMLGMHGLAEGRSVRRNQVTTPKVPQASLVRAANEVTEE